MRKNYPRPIQLGKRYRVNQYIRAREVDLIDEKGQRLGVMPTTQAIELAEERGFDLVEVSPLAQPPVAKIVDYGQLKYRQSKTQQKSKKIDLKTVKLSLKIGQHDIEVRRNQTEKFLSKGHKVHVALRLKGRERSQVPLARQIIENFLSGLTGEIIIEKPVAYLGSELSVTFYRKS